MAGRVLGVDDLLDRGDWLSLEDAYERLPGDQQRVLDLRYGLRPGTRAKTWNQVASELGMDARTAAGIGGLAVEHLERLLAS
jgi:DNA-directed RNA polymerase sigma subunit (sigma70/sigma32)